MINEDLELIYLNNRTWSMKNYISLWVSLSFCIPSYMLAGSLLSNGMNWYQAIFTIILGNLIVLIPAIIHGHAGAKYGISFPLLSRVSFGVRGASFAAFLRGVIACGWFGIAVWIGSTSLHKLITIFFPSFNNITNIFPQFLGIDSSHVITFIIFWLIHVYVIFRGMNLIKKMLLFSAFFIPLSSCFLLLWALIQGHGLSNILDVSYTLNKEHDFWQIFFPSLTAMVGFWAPVALNIPDFTRFSKDQKSHIIGQAVGLPPAMGIFAFMSIIITSATVIIYHQVVWDPVVLINKFSNQYIVAFAMISLMVVTLSANIAGNIVSPANDFVHIFPKYLNFKTAGLLTSIIGVSIMPWKLVADPHGYIFKWLIASSCILGAIAGILIIDYLLVSKQKIDEGELYKIKGKYWYKNGINYIAIISIIIGILPNIPGFLVQIELVSVNTFSKNLINLYDYAWFLSLAISAISFYLLTKIRNFYE